MNVETVAAVGTRPATNPDAVAGVPWQPFWHCCFGCHPGAPLECLQQHVRIPRQQHEA